MAHHRFDPIAAYERIMSFDAARGQRRDRRAFERDLRRMRRFVDTTTQRLQNEIERARRIRRDRDAGREPTAQHTVNRLGDLPGVADLLDLVLRVARDKPEAFYGDLDDAA